MQRRVRSHFVFFGHERECWGLGDGDKRREGNHFPHITCLTIGTGESDLHMWNNELLSHEVVVSDGRSTILQVYNRPSDQLCLI